MKRIMLAAMNSGSGKTVVTCALLSALKRRGLRVQAVKCGPDYIDPMFHRRAIGVPSRNADLFLMGEAGVQAMLRSVSVKADVAVMEAAMGFYDGVGGTDKGSAWHIAQATDTPVILVIRPAGASITLAAQINGVVRFRQDSHIAGLLLNDCKPSLFAHLKPILERETGLPVLGFLPHMEEAVWESRHLGLMTADEIDSMPERLDALSDQLERACDIDALLALAANSHGVTAQADPVAPVICRIAVARDEAFCFLYEENLEQLRKAGAEPVFFSPLADRSLPDRVDGLYLPGGYPELYALPLSQNTTMLRAIRDAVSSGLPTIAECGGFLYLQTSLEDAEGTAHPMCGALPGRGFKTDRLQRFGYLTLSSQDESMLFRRGDSIPAHEFHYWDSTDNGSCLTAAKGGRSWSCGFVSECLYAAFPHLCFGGALPLAERFVAAAVRYRNEHTK